MNPVLEETSFDDVGSSRDKEPARPALEETSLDEPPQQAAVEEPPQKAPPAQKQKISALGDFRLIKKLGEGGMGAVFAAHQISLDRPAAVKVMAKHIAAKPDLVERFYREARIMARLDHPNMVRSYAVGEAHGLHYLAMEFVDGGSLTGQLERFGKLSVGDSLHVILACASALAHANEHSIIHRDIKPDNVLLTKTGVVKLADMGLAKALTEDVGLTQTGIGAGTPLYVAPEQAANVKYADARSDIYSLGCMLYKCLTGDVPFKGESVIEILKAKEEGRFVAARRSNMDVPERLDLILFKMLARKPEQRYQTTIELIKDLEGLGLASATLSFIQSGDSPLSRPAMVPRTQAPSARPRDEKPVSRPAAPKIPPAEERDPEYDEENIWYVMHTTREGRLVTQRLTTDQVQRLIREPHFDTKAQASHTLNGTYRLLASYPQFAGTLHGLLGKEKADRKSMKMRSAFQDIIDAEEKRKRNRAWQRLYDRLTSGLGAIVGLAIIAGLLVGAYFLITKVIVKD